MFGIYYSPWQTLTNLQATKIGLESILQMQQSEARKEDVASELTALLLGISTVLSLERGIRRAIEPTLPRLNSPSRVATRTYLAFATPIPTSAKQRNL